MSPDEVPALVDRATREAQGLEEEEQRRRYLDVLPPVLAYLKKQPVAPAASAVDADLTKPLMSLGNAARSKPWRRAFGEAGILDFAVDLLATLERDDGLVPLRSQVLRVIGNSCAEIDPNRDLVFGRNGLELLMSQFDIKPTLGLAITVIYNMICGYETGERRACEARLTAALVPLIEATLGDEFKGARSMLFDLMGTMSDSGAERNAAKPDIALSMFRVALDPKLDLAASDPATFVSIVDVATAYLDTSEKRQACVALCPGPADLVVLVADVARGLSRVVTRPAHRNGREEMEELSSKHSGAMARITDIIAELTDSPALRLRPPFASNALLDLWREYLASGNHDLLSIACLGLANAIRSDEAAEHFVLVERIHLPLIDLLRDEELQNAQAVHAILGVLRHLAIPESLATRTPLGRSPLLRGHVLARIWRRNPVPAVQLAAVSLARLLVSKRPDNVALLCEPVPVPPGTGPGPAREDAAPSEEPAAADGQSKSTLATAAPGLPDGLRDAFDRTFGGRSTDLRSLLDLFRRSDTEPVKMEAARAVGIVTQEVHADFLRRDTTPPLYPDAGGDRAPEQDLELFHAFHDTIPEAMAYLVTQARFPVLTCEAVKDLALVSKTVKGAIFALGLLEREPVYRALIENVVHSLEPEGEVGLAGNGNEAVSSGTRDKAARAGTGDVLGRLVKFVSRQPPSADAPPPLSPESLETSQPDNDSSAPSLTKFELQNTCILFMNILSHGDKTGISEDRRKELDVLVRAGVASVSLDRKAEKEGF